MLNLQKHEIVTDILFVGEVQRSGQRDFAAAGSGRGDGDFVPIFHALIPMDFSRQNSESFPRLRHALKRHPCRIGLKWPSMAISPKL